MKHTTVLITGGAGFIGSHVNVMLAEAGYDTIILDNLSRGNSQLVKRGVIIEGDISDSSTLDHVFSSYPVSAVMHFAAFTDVGESVKHPLKYFQNNVSNTWNLLNSMQKHKIPIFIFSSSAAVYGTPITTTIKEDHPCHPINPYGWSKWIIETTLRDQQHALGIRAISLRYFNAAGGDPRGIIPSIKRKETNLIPLILNSLTTGDPITIYGTDYDTKDGTCIRDFVHIEDLGSAHIKAMEQLLSGASSNYFNLGNGHGFSVREVIAAAEEVTGRKAHVIEGPRRPGDPAVLVADAEKACRELGWKPQYTNLKDIIAHAWQAKIKTIDK